jgi:hypothetical protein
MESHENDILCVSKNFPDNQKYILSKSTFPTKPTRNLADVQYIFKEKIMELILRELKLQDLDDYLKWKHPSQEFRKYNGPYCRQETERELEELVGSYRSAIFYFKSLLI